MTSNKGKRTAGVDHVLWDTDARKVNAVCSLKRRRYKALPLKRVNIPKKNGKMRPLGIPTMRDRAMQALYLMALEPVTETTADANSYGFRKFRSTADAIDALHRWLSRDCSPQWILEGDIKGCFDHISHEWLLDNVRIDKHILGKWLKSGVVFNKLLQPVVEGTPQGGLCITVHNPPCGVPSLVGNSCCLNTKPHLSHLPSILLSIGIFWMSH